MKGFAYCTFAVWVVIFNVCWAAPEPAIVPRPADWTVEVRFEHPQQVLLQSGGAQEPKRFWYTIITLTNRTNHDVDFYPKCELMTDTFQIIPAAKGISVGVYQQIKQRHGKQYPFLESLEKVSNKILQGQDNAKDIAIIWPDFDAEASGIKLFITGLSNETVAVDHPIAKDESGKAVKIFLRKTLELNYDIGSDPAFRSEAKLVFEGKRWVMR